MRSSFIPDKHEITSFYPYRIAFNKRLGYFTMCLGEYSVECRL